jgi:hypothetical protein
VFGTPSLSRFDRSSSLELFESTNIGEHFLLGTSVFKG